jgi:hypothetical protein
MAAPTAGRQQRIGPTTLEHQGYGETGNYTYGAKDPLTRYTEGQQLYGAGVPYTEGWSLRMNPVAEQHAIEMMNRGATPDDVQKYFERVRNPGEELAMSTATDLLVPVGVPGSIVRGMGAAQRLSRLTGLSQEASEQLVDLTAEEVSQLPEQLKYAVQLSTSGEDPYGREIRESVPYTGTRWGPSRW